MARQAAFDWTSFRLGIYIAAKPEDLFRLWATAHGLCRWFLRTAAFAPSEGPPQRSQAGRRRITVPSFETLAARGDDEFCRTGDRYRWEWYYNDGVTGEDWMLDVRPPTRLTFGFGNRMEVEVLLRKQGAWCEAVLRQYNIPDTSAGRREMHMGCRAAWTFFLANLKCVAEGGPDLRETERARTRQLHLVNI